MRICVILEGCYPYVTGGVSSWMHQYIQAMPQHEFVVWAIGANSEDRGKFKYTLPDNVVEVKEIFLNDALTMPFYKGSHRFTAKEREALREFIECRNPDWETLFHIYHDKHVSPIAFLMSQNFLNILTQICREDYPYAAFSDLFHTVRSMMLPILYALQSEVPKADIYHAIATGYAGVLARLGSYVNHVPYLVSEHGIYTREREEEIIRANWVLPAFKKLWVKFFYMLSACAYQKATKVTALFERAMHMQIGMGCDPGQCRYIVNGIHYKDFCDIPYKKPDGFTDIGAVIRVVPIKDVKTLIYAFADLKARVPNVRLHIAGPEAEEEYAQECHDLVKYLRVQDVYFLGTVNVIEKMRDFDFTILTSISEGLPLSVLESFAAGRPCVVTDVGCCKELVGGMTGDELGAAGLCVPPMHREAISNAMEYLCVHPDERYHMGQVAKERVQRYFLHEDMISNYQETYEEVLSRWQGSVSV